jgi:RNA polymerase sigma-70 factor, ECF subfamily
MITTSINGTIPAICTSSDGELITAMREGDGQALEALLRRYVRLVQRIASDILRDRAEAEDITQEVFLEIYRKASLYDPSRGSVRTWLLQYAYRRTLRRKMVLARRAAYRGEPIEAADDERRQQARAGLTIAECRWVLQTALAQLPEKQRTTLELTCFEDLTLRDVAERLGVSVGCTRHYYYRGLARLQRWARITDRPRPVVCRGASRGDTTDDATDRGRRRLARI